MKKLFLTGIAALFLATGAQAEGVWNFYAEDVWHFNDYKRCTARVEFKIPPNPEDWMLTAFGKVVPNVKASIAFDRTNLAKLEAAVRFLKKMPFLLLEQKHPKKGMFDAE